MKKSAQHIFQLVYYTITSVFFIKSEIVRDKANICNWAPPPRTHTISEYLIHSVNLNAAQ